MPKVTVIRNEPPKPAPVGAENWSFVWKFGREEDGAGHWNKETGRFYSRDCVFSDGFRGPAFTLLYPGDKIVVTETKEITL